MRVIARRRLAADDGFTMIVAMMVLTISSLMIAAAFVAAKGDIGNTQHDIDGKRAYSAARAGLANFTYKLNKNTELWETCPSQATTQVPGGPTNLTYSYVSMPANGNPTCSATNPVGTMIDFATGSFRMKFTGRAGTPAVTRTIVASFRRDSPLDYLWYSKYETLDPNTYDDPADHADCATFRRDGRDLQNCGDISWITDDYVNGPMYTQDQYVICGTPHFGRDNGTDLVQTTATSSALVRSTGQNCVEDADVRGDPGNVHLDAGIIDPPPDNSNLLAYAQANNAVFSGQTTITLNGTSATVVNRPTSAAPTTTILNLATDPIIYVQSTTCTTAYSPYNVTYPTFSGCGNVYVRGTYSSSLTIAASNDIVITGDTTTSLTGSAVLGLVANNFIRIQHGVTTRCGLQNQGSCPASRNECGGADNQTSNPDYTHTGLEVDAAVLALNHSFIVDNYDCGDPITGNLNVWGAIAQLFRGTVGTTSGGVSNSGYVKDYNYDDRLAVLQPPYLFDIASSSWRVVRETSCVQGSADPAVAC